MKKKLLSLMMAAAMVATTSVGAFADTIIDGSDTQAHEAPVTITGDVMDDQGQTLPGTLQVTVPTAAAFTVDTTGALTAGKIKITNNGTQKVDVFAHKFVDTNKASGINVKKEEDVLRDRVNTPRTDVSLKIVGNEGTAYLSSDDKANGTGIFKDELHVHSLDNTRETLKLSSISPNSTNDLQLIGVAGGQSLNAPVKDTFTLTLKIAKSTTP